MAKDVLAIQITSVGPERVFSTARYCGGYTRAKLKAENLKSMVFCRYTRQNKFAEIGNVSCEDAGLVDDDEGAIGDFHETMEERLPGRTAPGPSTNVAYRMQPRPREGYSVSEDRDEVDSDSDTEGSDLEMVSFSAQVQVTSPRRKRPRTVIIDDGTHRRS